MKYIVLIVIALLLITADVITGLIKANVTKTMKSSKLRIGGLKKLSEVIIILTTNGVDYLLNVGDRYNVLPDNTSLAGLAISMSVFVYMATMELISIFENYYVINPQAKWVKRLLNKLDDEREE